MKNRYERPPQRSLLRRSLLTLALGLALGQSVHAQDTSGAIFGRLPSGLTGKVIVENLETGLRREVVASEDGRFRLPGLPNGRYRVLLDRDGETVAESAVSVNAGAGSEVVLAAGAAAATTELDGVVVTANGGNAIDVSTVESPLVISANDLQKMPIAQNITAISLLAPGVAEGDSRYNGGRFNSLPSFGGSAVSENAYYINGFPVLNPLTNYGYSELPFNSIDQIQLATGGYGVEYGRATGGVVNVITKRGSNEWKAGGQLIWRPESLTAAPRNIYYSKDTDRDEAGTIYRYRNENLSDKTTASTYVSGPLIKDKLFIYAAAEFVREDGAETDRINGTSTTNLSPTVGWNDYTYRSPRWLVKTDWNITDSHRLELTGFSDRLKRSVDSSGFDYETLKHDTDRNGGLYQNEQTTTYIGNYTGYLTDSLTLTAMYGESKWKYDYVPLNYDPTCPRIAWAAGSQIPGLTYPTCQSSPSATLPIADKGDKVKNGRIDLEYRIGDHTLKGGYDYNNARSVTGESYAGGESWIYYRSSNPNTPVDASAGIGSPASGGGYGTDGYYVLNREYVSRSDVQVKQKAMYIKDLWQISDNVLLEIGVRSEEFANYNSAGVAFAKKSDQIAPRFGATWDVNGDSSLKLFANAGRYHLAMPNNVAVRGADGALNVRQAFTYTGIDPVTGAPTGLTSLGPVWSPNNEFGEPKDPRTVAASNLRSHYQDAFSFGMEQNLGAFNVGAKASYRTLGSAIDDFCDYRPFVAAAIAGGMDPAVAQEFSHEFSCAMFNPGQSNTFWQDVDGDGVLEKYNLSASQLGYPKVKRKSYALDFFLERPFDGTWYARVDYTYSKNWGNTEGQLLSDLGQVDVSATQAWDFPELMEHASGLLPNHRKHQIKARGYYQFSPEWTFSSTLMYASGRPRNCIGLYPDSESEGAGYDSGYFYCDGKPSPRGTYGSLPATYRVDFGVRYAPEWAKGVTLSADVFNVLNRQSVQNVYEQYNQDSTGTIDPNFGRPISFTAPRSVQFTARYDW